jgi:UDP-glucose 4-epimerase
MSQKDVRSVFVTGGAGFIGSHLVDRMIGRGVRVTVYDNFVSGKREWIAHHASNPLFKLVEADLLDRAKLTEAIAGHDVVWHFGANTDIPSGFKQTRLDLDNCVVATCNTLEAMKTHGIQRMLFASSGAVYGEVASTSTTEVAGPLLPLSLYGAGKLACEAFISAYASLFGIRAWMFRFGNVIGSRMGHGVIYDFIQKLMKNPHELEILGDGKQEKNYFMVDECLDGMEHALEHIPMTAEKPSDVFNLGAQSSSPVPTIARIVIEEMGLKDVKYRYTGGRGGWPGDQPRVQLVFDQMKKHGWSAKRSSDEAVRLAARAVIHDLAIAAAKGK